MPEAPAPPRAALIDSHAHLDGRKLAPRQDELLARAREAGVVAVVNIGADVPSSRASVALARRHSMVYATVGIHPHDAKDADEASWAELERLTADERVVAIGECGLDFFRDLSPRGVQRAVFARHLALAERLELPVVIHCRDAYLDCLEVLRAERQAPVRGILHCFQGDGDAARGALDLGLHIALGGSITFPRDEALRRVVSELPLDRLLVETDCPYLTPRPKRGRNEPAYVRLVAEHLASLLGVPFERVAEATTANARAVYGLPPPVSDPA